MIVFKPKAVFSPAARAGLLCLTFLAGGTLCSGPALSQSGIIEANITDPDGNKPAIVIRRTPPPSGLAAGPLFDPGSLAEIKVDENNKEALPVGRLRPRPGERGQPRPNPGPFKLGDLGQIQVDPVTKEAVPVGRLRPSPPPGGNKPEAEPAGRVISGSQTWAGYSAAELLCLYQPDPNHKEAVPIGRIGHGPAGGYAALALNDLEPPGQLKLDHHNKEAILVGRLRPRPDSVEAVSLGRLNWPGLDYPPKDRLSADDQGKFYMFRGDDGVMYLTDAPTDPRYRPFQVTIRFQVAQSGGSRNKLSLALVRPYIQMAAVRHNLDPALIAAVIKAESAFDPKAVSWAGAQGLMQLIPSTARLVGCLDPFHPQDNIMGGSQYLRMMLTRFNGDLVKAIAAYNCGPERVAKANGIPNIRETQSYVKIVLANYEKYRHQFARGQ